MSSTFRGRLVSDSQMPKLIPVWESRAQDVWLCRSSQDWYRPHITETQKPVVECSLAAFRQACSLHG